MELNKNGEILRKGIAKDRAESETAIAARLQESKDANALMGINAQRAQDGLDPLDKLPASTEKPYQQVVLGGPEKTAPNTAFIDALAKQRAEDNKHDGNVSKALSEIINNLDPEYKLAQRVKELDAE